MSHLVPCPQTGYSGNGRYVYTYEDGYWSCIDVNLGSLVKFASKIPNQVIKRIDDIIYYIDLSYDKQIIALRYDIVAGTTDEVLKNRKNKVDLHLIRHVNGYPVIICGKTVMNIQGNIIANTFESEESAIVLQVLDDYIMIAWIIKKETKGQRLVTYYKIMVGNVKTSSILMSLEYTGLIGWAVSKLDSFEAHLYYDLYKSHDSPHSEHLREIFRIIKCENVIYVKTDSNLFKLSDVPALKECCICFEEGLVAKIINPCRHYSACSKCTSKISKCPICRADIVSTISLY